jgi:CBS domain-containing protein
VFDLIGGRATWTAFGLPTEGSVGDRRRISHFVVESPTVGVDATVGDVPTHAGPIAVIAPDGVLLGSVDGTTIAGLPTDTPLAPIMVPAPGTIRPELRVEEVARRLADDSLDHVFVTTIAGVLLGVVHRDGLHV